MWVMVSGIKRMEDVLSALKLGANAFGLVVECEDGFISPEVARSVTESLSSVYEDFPSFQMQTQQEDQGQFRSSGTDRVNSLTNSPRRIENLCGSVLVTHITDVQKIVQLAGMIGVTTVLLAGDITSEDIVDIKNSLPYIKIIKSLPVVDDSSIIYVKDYIHIIDAIELDTMDMITKRIGGTGRTHDWTISKKIVQEYEWQAPIILGGGLRSDNIEKAIQTVKPVGVDVSASVMNSQGILDAEKLKAFIYKAKYFKCERT